MSVPPLTLPTLPFDNRFAQLPSRLHTRQNPVPVKQPALFAFNQPLGARLGIDRTAIGDHALAAIFSGNVTLPGSEPLAAVYGGHQFGNWAGQLGDGRAVLLGELESVDGARFDVQLKGSGRTPYSRGGDGRAWLGPVIREYLISNAMPQYGVDSTLALAAVTTGEMVLRENGPLPGAIVTRVAKSHVRVGTFEYLAAQRDLDGARAVVDLLIDTHFTDSIHAENRTNELLNAAIKRQATLIANWQAIGFIHGVMNTDNASLVGETIDFGPCAFMDEFDRSKVFSSIDQHGRYAYQNQPRIGHWNMAMLAQALLPLLSDDEETAVDLAQTAVDRFPALYAEQYKARMCDKLGLFDAAQENDMDLIEALLDLMQADTVDFTQAFRALSQPGKDQFIELFNDRSSIETWHQRWSDRVNGLHDSARMLTINPAVVPRNHWIEATIEGAVQGDWSLFNDFEKALASPYQEHDTFSQPPRVEERVTATFCGT